MVDRTTVGLTFVFTDLVGSTELMSSLSPDAADAARREHLGLLRNAIRAAGGSEVKNLGDGVMVAFTSTSRAVGCAVAMQQAAGRHNSRSNVTLALRIGIACGEVTEEDDDYFGEAVVEAARLCAAANGGQILATGTVRAMVGRHAPVELSPVGDMQLKGLPEPVPVVEVVWSSEEAGASIPLPGRVLSAATDGLFSFFGRSPELEQLDAAVKQAATGLRLVLIAGEPGIGKTALAAQAARAAHAKGSIVVFGSCDEVLSTPFRPWSMALAHLLRYAPAGVMAALEPASAVAIQQILPSGAAEAALTRGGGRNSETERMLLFDAVAALLEVAVGDAPLVLMLDDLHWADSASLDLLRHLVRSGPALRAAVIGTYRDSEVGRGQALSSLLADLWREPTVGRINLRGLADVELVELMEAAAGHDMPTEGIALAHALHRETDGNPFFAVELLRNLAESGAFELGDDGRYAIAADLDILALPTSVREVIGERVARLGEAAATVLSTAAVIGQEFDLELLVATTDQEENALLELLERAANAGVVVESSEMPGRYRFVHALIPHTLMQDMGPTRRQRAHLQVAQALEALDGESPDRVTQLAQHWLAATRPASPERALHWLLRAGHQATDALAPADAISWLRQGLELLERQPRPDPRERGLFLAALAQAQVDAGHPDFPATLSQANRAALELRDPELFVAVAGCFQGGSNEVSLTDPERIAVFEAALAAISPADSANRARLLVGLAEEIDRREWERRRELALQAVDLARRLGDRRTLAEVLTRSLMLRAGPDDEGLRADSVLANAIAHELGATSLLVYSLPALFLSRIEDAELDEACKLFGEMEGIAERTGISYHHWRVHMLRSFLQLLGGDTAAAEASTNAAFELGAVMDYGPAYSTFGAQLMEIRRQQGRLEEVVEVAERGVQEFETLPGWNAALAVLYSELGQFDKVRAIVEPEAAAGFGGIPRDVTWLLAMASWADCICDLHDPHGAPLLIERLAPHAQRVIFTSAHTLGAVGRSLGRLLTLVGDYAGAEKALTDALRTHIQLRAPYWTARTQYDLARLLNTRQGPGDAGRAASHADEADRIAETYGLGGLRVHAQPEPGGRQPR